MSTKRMPGQRAWENMKARCYWKGHHAYHRYGGRGIFVCDRWLESFEAFRADMGPRPPGKTIGRIDNDGPYSPENCRWESAIEQQNNKRNTRYVCLEGVTKPLADWCRELGVDYQLAIRRIVKQGWDEVRALRAPKTKPTDPRPWRIRSVFRCGKKFAARIRVGDDKKQIGTFDTPELAYAAYVEVARESAGLCSDDDRR